MALDSYITLGHSGLRVSPLCLGTMTFGEDSGWGSSVEESQQILDRFIELGGNFIDTANGYTKGHSEKIIGDHVGRDAAKRDRPVIATKFSSNLTRRSPRLFRFPKARSPMVCEFLDAVVRTATNAMSSRAVDSFRAK